MIFISAFSSSLYADTSTPSAVDGISYRIIEKSAEKPVKLSLKHIEFFGTNKSAIEHLNHTVKKIWRDEEGCTVSAYTRTSDLDESGLERMLTVKMLNGKVAILAEEVHDSCPGSAHPENYTRDHIIDVSSGDEVDFFKRLPLASQKKILKSISTMGFKARQGEKDCQEEYLLKNLTQNEIRFSIENGQASLTPSFRHATQACEEALTISIEEFKKHFKGDTKTLEILNALK